eukprot:Gb_35464 [translate_table: standard]
MKVGGGPSEFIRQCLDVEGKKPVPGGLPLKVSSSLTMSVQPILEAADGTFIFIGETFARICRRGHAVSRIYPSREVLDHRRHLLREPLITSFFPSTWEVGNNKRQAEIHDSFDSRSANSSSSPLRSQSSITRFFQAASNVRRVSSPRTRSLHRVVQPSHIRPGLSSEGFIQQCIGSFTVVGDSAEISSSSATITTSIGTMDASSSVDVM